MLRFDKMNRIFLSPLGNCFSSISVGLMLISFQTTKKIADILFSKSIVDDLDDDNDGMNDDEDTDDDGDGILDSEDDDHPDHDDNDEL